MEPAVKGDERGYALKLSQNVTEYKLRRWSQGNPSAWANEAHNVATLAIYGELQHAGDTARRL